MYDVPAFGDISSPEYRTGPDTYIDIISLIDFDL